MGLKVNGLSAIQQEVWTLCMDKLVHSNLRLHMHHDFEYHRVVVSFSATLW